MLKTNLNVSLRYSTVVERLAQDICLIFKPFGHNDCHTSTHWLVLSHNKVESWLNCFPVKFHFYKLQSVVTPSSSISFKCLSGLNYIQLIFTSSFIVFHSSNRNFHGDATLFQISVKLIFFRNIKNPVTYIVYTNSFLKWSTEKQLIIIIIIVNPDQKCLYWCN